ncbi:phosphoenolpyruvate carboxylase, partial [Streptococcus pneumoniae]|uniref:phosphoenolpyruvate carboxylase n=1 Tax=Streptococcus pneumoniae TaxID=1313 RepID=UPI003D6638FF
MSEDRRMALLCREIASARPIVSPFQTYSDETAAELNVFRAAAEAHKTYGKSVIGQCIISMTKG